MKTTFSYFPGMIENKLQDKLKNKIKTSIKYKIYTNERKIIDDHRM